MEKKENNFKSKKITTSDGTIMYMFNGKLHNWEILIKQYGEYLRRNISN